MQTHRIVHDGGAQAVRVIAVNDQGDPTIPSSAAYTVIDLREPEDSTTREVQASTAATIDSLSTTTTGTAGPVASDDRVVPVASAAGISEGTWYLLEDGGQREAVLVDFVDGLDVHVRDRLSKIFSAGAAFQGLEVSGTFPAAEAADDDALVDGAGPYAIDWTFVGVVPERARDLAWIVRTAEKSYATLGDLRILDPVSANVSRDLIDPRAFLEQAHRDFRGRLRELGIDPDVYHGGENARDAVTLRAAMYIRRQLRGEGNVELSEWFERRYQGMTANLAAQGTVITDPHEDYTPESGSTTIPIVHWRRT